MSQITTAFDAFVTRVDAVLTSGNGWMKLPNAYAINQNPDIMLKKGYAVGIGAGSNTKKSLGNLISIRRNLFVHLSRALDALDLDVSLRQTTEKTLLEDLKLLVADVETAQTLNAGQIFVTFEGDDGIESIDGESSEFRAIKANFVIEYFEQL
jgi:hypothetical protein